MENIFIAIVTDDKEYGRSLSLGLLNVYRGFIIRIFNAEEFLKESRKFDLLLWDGIEARAAYGGRIVYLAERASQVVVNNNDKRYCIYKYSTAAAMVSAIFEIYENLTGKRVVSMNSNVEIYTFSSCEGGAGCTTIAMAVAQEMCRFQGKRVFYLSFEELDSVGNYIKREHQCNGAAPYLYELFSNIYNYGALNNNSDNTIPFIEGHIVRDDFGMEAFASSYGRNPLRGVNKEEVYEVIASIANSGRYDVIIMDIGQWLSSTGIKCLEIAEKICFVTVDDGCEREDKYFNQIMSCCGETIMDKVIRVFNEVKGSNKRKTDKDKKNEDTDAKITISRSDFFVGGDGFTRIILENRFGKDIETLTKKLTSPM